MQDFNTLEEMFESPAYTLDKIVHVEITVGDIYE